MAFGAAFVVLSLWSSLDSASSPDGLDYLPELLWFGVLVPAAAPAYATVGAVVASRRPDNGVGWMCLVLGGVVAVGWSAQAYASRALEAVDGSLPAGAFAALVGDVANSALLVPVMLMLLLFPDGRLPSPRWRLVVWPLAVVAGLRVLAVGVGPRVGDAIDREVRNPLGLEGLGSFTEALDALGFFATPIMLLASVASVIVRWRRAGGIEREQLKWLAYAGVAVAGGLVVGVASALVFGEDSYLGFLAFSAGIGGLTVGVPVAIGVAVLRHQLYDIDLIINRTLVYGTLTATLVAVYFGGVVTLQRTFVVLTGQESTLAVVASTLVIAALASPLRRRIQSLIDRRFYRKRYDARKTLEAFSTKLRDETDLQALDAELAGVVRQTMQPAHFSLLLLPGRGPSQENRDTSGGPSPPSLTHPQHPPPPARP
jgi:hypothetical protein